MLTSEETQHRAVRRLRWHSGGQTGADEFVGHAGESSRAHRTPLLHGSTCAAGSVFPPRHTGAPRQRQACLGWPQNTRLKCTTRFLGLRRNCASSVAMRAASSCRRQAGHAQRAERDKGPAALACPTCRGCGLRLAADQRCLLRPLLSLPCLSHICPFRSSRPEPRRSCRH